MNIEGEEGDALVLEGGPEDIVDPNPPEPVAAEPELDPEPAPERPPKRPLDPIIATITSLRADKRQLEADRDAARKEARDARELAERLAKGEGGDGTPKPPAQPHQPLDDAEIDRRAEYKLFLRDVGQVKEAGEAAFGRDEFKSAVDTLTAYGADNDEFIRQVMAVDRSNAHALLKEIAEDAPRAIGLVNMNSTQRIAELTKMSIAKTAAKAVVEPSPKPAATAPRAISNAPKPAPAISSSSATVPDWRSDKASDDEFTRGFNEMLKKRNARR